jgi:hypothetical protein
MQVNISSIKINSAQKEKAALCAAFESMGRTEMSLS